jgi:hypothetical protein
MTLLKDQPEKTPLPGYFALCNDGGQFRILDAFGRKHRMRPERGTPVHYEAGVQQVLILDVTTDGETATAGEFDVRLIGFDVLVVDVSVTLVGGENNDAVATAIRAALSAESLVTDLYSVGGSGRYVLLTRNTPEADDPSAALIVLPNDVSVEEATSGIDVSGVARVFATVGSAGDELFDDEFRYIAVADVTETSVSGWKKVALSDLA